MKKVSLFFCLLFTLALVFISCKSSTEPDDKNGIPGSGISSSSFAFNVGNEWNYSGKGYNTFNSQILKSVGTARLKVLSQTNSNGLNGFKMYYDSKDYQGNNMGYTEFFISTENDGLWTLEKLPNGSTSPLKLLPFNTNSSVIRSEILNDQLSVFDSAGQGHLYYHYENIQLTIDIKFEYLGTENITAVGGNFNNCQKIKVTLDASQKSDTNGVVLFDGKTWNAETTWWLLDNNGLIKTETVFNTVIDSIRYSYWDPNTGTIKYEYKDIITWNFSVGDFRWIDADDLMISVSDHWNWFKIRGNNSLKYLGKYVNELTSKNF